MTLVELKSAIIDNQLSDDLLILLCQENHFLAEQYIDAICEIKNIDRVSVNTLMRADSALSLVMDFSKELRVLSTEMFDEDHDDYSQFQNTIVICDKIDKKIEKKVEKFTVKMPKLVDWQVKAYMKTICHNITDDDCDWLYKNSGGDIYRIKNELDKIALFIGPKQAEIFTELRYDPDTDLYNLPIFSLTDAIIEHNSMLVADFLRHKKQCDIEPLSLVGILLNNYKKILLVTQKSGAKLEDLQGMSQKAYNAISYRYRGYPLSGLMSAIDFLSNIDMRLKSGLLDMPNSDLLDYIICKLAV